MDLWVLRLLALSKWLRNHIALIGRHARVDIAGMKESSAIRVPMLAEELFSFGLSLHII
jgi:hypothetical protein